MTIWGRCSIIAQKLRPSKRWNTSPVSIYITKELKYHINMEVNCGGNSMYIKKLEDKIQFQKLAEDHFIEVQDREINNIMSKNEINNVDLYEAFHSSVDKNRYSNLLEGFSILRKKGNWVELGCLYCNKIIKVKYDVCLSKNFECPSCKLYSFLEQEVDDYFEYGEDEVFSQKMKIVLSCKKCGERFTTNPAKLRYGIHCTRCDELERERKNAIYKRKHRTRIVTSSNYVRLSKETKKIMVGINKLMSFSLSCTNLHSDIIKCEWGENEGLSIPLYITPMKIGTAILKIKLDNDIDEKYIFVEVIGSIDVQCDDSREEYELYGYKYRLLKADVRILNKENELMDIEVIPYILCTQINEEDEEPYALSKCYLINENGETVGERIIGTEITQSNEIWTTYLKFVDVKYGKYHINICN